MEEDLKPILEFRKYRLFDNGAIRELYSILRAAIKASEGCPPLQRSDGAEDHGQDALLRLEGVGHQEA
jgi:hypothetical protein